MPGPELTNGVVEEPERFIDKFDPEDPEYKRELMRPADIKEDVKLMEQRKRVSLILNSEAFRRELEEIIESQLKSGPHPASLIALQQISELLLPHARYGSSAFSRGASAPNLPINDVRGVEASQYERGERLQRCKVASIYRLVDMFGWTQHGFTNHITARVGRESDHFLINPTGLFYHEITASTLLKVDQRGEVVDPGSTLLSFNADSFRQLHAPVYSARSDVRCIIHLSTPALSAVSSLKCGLLPVSREALLVGPVSCTAAWGKDEISRDDISSGTKVLIVRGQGVLVCGESIEESWQLANRVVLACEAQLRLGPNVDAEKLFLPSEEEAKQVRDAALEAEQREAGVSETGHKWQRGELEFEGLMRHLDNAGYRTGYIYHQPIVKMERRQRRHDDVEVPPASSSFAYYEDDYVDGNKLANAQKMLADRQKAAQRTEWLTSPNSYHKEEIEETGTSKPKKYTRWVANKGDEGASSGHATPIHSTNQFAPQGANPHELKEQQKKVKSKYFQDDVSAGPQSKVLDGLSQEEVRKLVEEGRAQYSGDHVVMVGAASKGIIQREHQHNAVVYKDVFSPNPFDRVTDEDLDAYRQSVEKKDKGDDEEKTPEPSQAESMGTTIQVDTAGETDVDTEPLTPSAADHGEETSQSAAHDDVMLTSQESCTLSAAPKQHSAPPEIVEPAQNEKETVEAASVEKGEPGSPEHLSPPKKSDTLRSDTSGAGTSHDEGDSKSPSKEDKKKKKIGFRMPSFSKKKDKK